MPYYSLEISWCLWTFLGLLSLPGVFLSQDKLNKLLLVSFDGFRWDYLDRVSTPNFDSLIKSGVQVERVYNAYITKTYPDHYTLVTGLHAESHGIVANEMYDPDINRTFSMDRMDIYDSIWWDEAIPIWVSNQEGGHRSGAAMWPGSDVKIHGKYPTHYMLYNESTHFEVRVQQLISWFMSTEPINFGLLYWEEPDESGHRLGPENPEMNDVISQIDSNLGYLLDQLKKSGLYDELNLVVTSDHGMSQMSLDRVIELDNYVDRDLYTWIDKSPVVGILPKEGRFEEVYTALEKAHPNMTVYKRESIPERYYYKYNSRIQPILAEAKEGWTIMRNKSDTFMLGNHGYDNMLPSMHPIFIAHGPAFRKNYSKKSMQSVDLYPLMCQILGISPAPNNGSLSHVQDLLAESSPLGPVQQLEDSHSSLLGAILGFALVVGFLIIFVKQVTQKQIPVVPITNIEIVQPLLQD
ncbi:ectonucleotide pyrophosphatase/phosphodiesterase family member 5 [Lepisosteus oculatus]|nr:PREDICTED: ectonucleotide pyrophosphatase/phosphodiesterase family member 5 [Lepisosteus oculatus]